MAEAVLYCITEEILKNLGSAALHEIALVWGFKSRLRKLKNTICTIKNILLVAEEKQADNYTVRGWLERLTTAVYAADDLFDEFTTVAARRQLMGRNKVTKEVQTFFSYSNQIAFALKISQKIKSIRQELDDIVKDSTQFAFVFRPPELGRVMNTSTGRDQTYSFVDAEEVIGRDSDKKVILDTLLTSSSSDDEHQHEHRNKVLPVIPIVGMGGMGKTTLAQLIYNDPQVEEFFEMKLWVCVSDVFDIKEICEKILMSATNTEIPKLEMEQLQGRLRKEIYDKKYLLVLDDVWNENRELWLKLRAFLNIGRNGCKVLVTTRSREVAEIMGTFPPYELQGLSEKKSWDLFEKMAFKLGEAQQKPHMVKVGKEIVKKCGNVPLAIRTVGSLLYGKEESKWFSFKDTNLVKLSGNQSDIVNILRLSYHHLWSPLKNCFTYCALFPKDYEFDKEMLIDLWIAEGFIIPAAGEGQSLYEAAEEHFFILLQRGFFQDIRRNEWKAIISCKMHDLMHELAQEVAGVKCKVANFEERKFDDQVLHLSLGYQLTSLWKVPDKMPNKNRVRTFLLPQQINDELPFSESICQWLIKKFSCLRVLDLHNLALKSLPSSIGKLIHLRFLNLSGTHIEELPDSITELLNLQTLNLHLCQKLRTLPADIRKLTNLRSLDVDWCDNLTHMPSGIGGLTSLNKLPKLIVNHMLYPDFSYRPNCTAKLSDLRELNNLRRSLAIDIHGGENNMLEATEADLSCKRGLTELLIKFIGSIEDVDEYCNHDEAVLEALNPYSSLRKLEITWYRGEKLPSWASKDNFRTTLPNLVVIILHNFTTCQQLPAFSQLPFLKCLVLTQMASVEYIESGVCDASASSESQTPFFPSLEELDLVYMENLKGWWKDVGATVSKNEIKGSLQSSEVAGIGKQHDHHLLTMQFSKLSKLTIDECPNLILLPLCPNLEVLTLKKISKNLSLLKMTETSTTTTIASTSGLKLKELKLDRMENLVSFPKQCLQKLSSLSITRDKKLVSTKSLEVFATLSHSLQSLKFRSCNNLRSISEGLEHLTALEKLVFCDCTQLDLYLNEHLEDGEVIPWKTFKTSLRTLRLKWMSQIERLPIGLQHLTNLHSLVLSSNHYLKELPEWISCFSSLEYMQLRSCDELMSLPEGFRKLTALNELQIIRCKGLTEKCRDPNGRDWPKIKHIPHVFVIDKDDFFD